MSDLIERQDVKEILRAEWVKLFPMELDPYLSLAMAKIESIPSAEPWSAVKAILNELEQKEERLYSDYCDAAASLKAINKIAKSSQTPKQKIDGIKTLAEMGASE